MKAQDRIRLALGSAMIDRQEIKAATQELVEKIEQPQRKNGYEIEIYVTDPAGNEVAGPYETMEEALKWVEDAEPFGAGADPFGRPDPQTNPEYWTE